MPSDAVATYAVTDEWLEHATATTGTYQTIAGYNPWTYPYVYHPNDPEITLKLSEVEHLRKRARGDAKLKRILRKFTPHIRITVDFD